MFDFVQLYNIKCLIVKINKLSKIGKLCHILKLQMVGWFSDNKAAREEKEEAEICAYYYGDIRLFMDCSKTLSESPGAAIIKHVQRGMAQPG